MTSGSKAQINLTPMIDVLLVLLIIFMVIIPEHSTGLDATAPPPAQDTGGPPPPPRDIVVSVHADRTIDINSEKVTWENLAERLKTILVRRPDGVFFIAGAPNLDFVDIAHVLDEARGVGISRIGIMPKSFIDARR